jgi:hypothetical protein
MHIHPEHWKGVMHMAVFFIVMLRVHAIDKKLSLLERKFTRH